MHLLICHKNKLLLFQAPFTLFYDKYTPNSFKVSLLHKDPSSVYDGLTLKNKYCMHSISYLYYVSYQNTKIKKKLYIITTGSTVTHKVSFFLYTKKMEREAYRT